LWPSSLLWQYYVLALGAEGGIIRKIVENLVEKDFS